MPTEKTGKPSSVASSPASDQPGASEDAATVQMCQQQNPPSEAMGQVALVPQRQTRPYCSELLSIWSNARWYQIPLSSLRKPKAGLFSRMFQSSLQAYQQLRKNKRLKVGRPFSVLPLPDFPSTLPDCAQETSRKQHDRHRRLRARGAKGSKRHHSSRKGPLGHSQQMPAARARKRRALAPPLPERHVVRRSGTPHQRVEEEPSSTSREKEQQVNPGCTEWPALDSDPCGLSRWSSSDCALAEAVAGGSSTNLWTNGCSPLEEEEDADVDTFPSDWTPPRVEFLYYEDLPVLSPAPGLVSESRSSGEMPDITEEPVEWQGAEFVTEAASLVGGNSPSREEAAAMQPRSVSEVENEDGAGSEPFYEAANRQRGGGSLADPAEGERQSASDPGHSPLPSPIPPCIASWTVCSRSDVSTSSDEFGGDTESLALELGEVAGPEHPPLPSPPTHPLMTSSRNSSRGSIFASSDELSGDPGSLALGSDTEEDLNDSDLVPLSDLFEMGSRRSQSTVELNQVLCSGSDCYLSSLDKLLEEKREQTWEDRELERSLGEKLLLSRSLESVEAAEGSIDTFPEAHRFLLEQFSIRRGTIPGVHPGESIFLPSPSRRTAPSLDTAELSPQNMLENFFFRSQFDQQVALLQNGFLDSLYLGMSHCPHPVLRWLFQLMSFHAEVSADAFRVLWEVSARQLASSADPQRLAVVPPPRPVPADAPSSPPAASLKLLGTRPSQASDEASSADVWCPRLQEITQAFYNLGACESALYPAGRLQLEFRHEDLQFSAHALGSADMKSESLPEEAPCCQRALAVMLGDIFKFLTLCVASRPRCFPDHQCRALLLLLCRLSLDSNLRKQPQVELQQLLLVLLEVVQDWQEELPELCRILCHVSQHHHNLVAIVRLFPDTTARGRHLRRNLSLCCIAKLLGKMPVATSPWQEDRQLLQLGRLLPLMKPVVLKQGLRQVQSPPGQPGKEQQQEALAELDEQACYLCYSLLTLANVVVGTNARSSKEQGGHLQRLCALLQQHISTSLREDPRLLYRTELKHLAAQTYVKWQELLPPRRGPLDRQGQSKNI